jgi:hypothetical protein
MFTIRNLGGVALFLFGTTYLVRTKFCAPGRTRTYDRQIRNRP